jgi:hypothetical protein
VDGRFLKLVLRELLLDDHHSGFVNALDQYCSVQDWQLGRLVLAAVNENVLPPEEVAAAGDWFEHRDASRHLSAWIQEEHARDNQGQDVFGEEKKQVIRTSSGLFTQEYPAPDDLVFQKSPTQGNCKLFPAIESAKSLVHAVVLSHILRPLAFFAAFGVKPMRAAASPQAHPPPPPPAATTAVTVPAPAPLPPAVCLPTLKTMASFFAPLVQELATLGPAKRQTLLAQVDNMLRQPAHVIYTDEFKRQAAEVLALRVPFQQFFSLDTVKNSLQYREEQRVFREHYVPKFEELCRILTWGGARQQTMEEFEQTMTKLRASFERCL